MGQALSDEEVALLDAYWRAANYLSVGQLYLYADGRLRALAGGNSQFGGLYDLLGLSRDYDSDRLFARFAAVRRGRMVAW